MLLAVVGGVIVAVAFVLCLALSQGLESIVRFFTVPSLEARSGKKYTPVSGAKRFLEKIDEAKEEPD